MTSPSNFVFLSRVSPSRVSAVTLFPEPDSPTIPSTRPRSSSKSTPSTARTTPSSVAKRNFKPLTSSRRSAINGPLGGTDSGVEVPVEDVDDRAEEDDEERPVKRHAHDRREVEVADRLRRVPAHAVQVEDGLGEDRAAADHRGEVEAEQAHDRDQRVPEHVLEQHPLAREAL